MFTTKAHTFQIDPQTKKNWKPVSTEAVQVSILAEGRSVFRIFAGESGKPVVNSVLTAASAFTRTSPKFGQWTDLRASTVYGLGFSVDVELTKVCIRNSTQRQFADQFDEIVRDLKAPLAPPSAEPVAKAESVPAPKKAVESSSDDLPEEERSDSQASQVPIACVRLTVQLATLKYENERLRAAMATSAAHARQWEVELAVRMYPHAPHHRPSRATTPG